MPGSGTNNCLYAQWSFETDSQVGGADDEFSFDPATMDDLTSDLAEDEAYIDASQVGYVEYRDDTALPDCLTGILVWALGYVNWLLGAPGAPQRIRIRKIPPLRRIRIRKH